MCVAPCYTHTQRTVRIETAAETPALDEYVRLSRGRAAFKFRVTAGDIGYASEEVT